MDILEKKQSELINACRFPLMVLVVLIHGGAAVLSPYSTFFNNVDMFELISRGISQNLATIAVPCFFLISGFLFFKNINNFTSQVYFNQLRKRAFTLLIPYLLWNILFIGVILLKNYIFIAKGVEVDDLYHLLHKKMWVELLWSDEFPINYPLWYLRDLICMVLLAPAFYFYFRYLNIFGVLLIILINLLGIDTGIPGLSITGLTYFGIGSYLALNKRNIRVEFSAVNYLCLIGAILFGSLSYYFIDTPYFLFLNRMYIIFGIVTFFNGIAFLIKNRNVKLNLMRLAAPVFFIYCVHAFYFIEFLRGFFSRTFLAHSEFGLIITYFLITPLVLSICIALYYVLVRFFPIVMSLLLGYRKPILDSEK